MKNKSSCCGAEVYIYKKRDGMYFYKCRNCDNPCDLTSTEVIETNKEWEKELSGELDVLENAISDENRELAICARERIWHLIYGLIDSRLSTKEKEAFEKGCQSVLDEMEEDMRKFREGFSYRKK